MRRIVMMLMVAMAMLAMVAVPVLAQAQTFTMPSFSPERTDRVKNGLSPTLCRVEAPNHLRKASSEIQLLDLRGGAPERLTVTRAGGEVIHNAEVVHQDPIAR